MFILPQRKDKPPIEFKFDEFKSIVLLGANGSGKTRLSVWIENNFDNVHRISAQKSLSMPENVSPTTKEKAIEEFLYSYSNSNKDWLKKKGKNTYRWGNNPVTILLNDFDKLLTLLHTEEYEASVEFKDQFELGKDITKPVTKLDIIQNIWEEVLPHRKLKKRAGKIEVYSKDKPSDFYNASQMSDGERLVFYFIGEVICAPDNSIIVIDEPENHLHKSIIKRLWDKIENVRPDCKLIYLTHDLDFAISRNNAKLIWLKSYEGNEVWNYEIIENVENIPKEIYLEILGSRSPILFIEGDKSSHDYYIYQQLFKDYTVVPLGSCEKVIETTKAFNRLSHFHNLTAKGIIDRDRRKEEEIQTYASHGIYVPLVAEVENFFLIEGVIKIIATIQRKDPIQVFGEVKKRVIEFFKSEIDKQVYEYATSIVKSKTIQELNKKFETYKQFEENYRNILGQINIQSIYQEIREVFEQYITQEEYNNIIKVFNHKGLIAHSRVAELCGLNYKGYIDLVKSIVKEESDEGEKLREEMRKFIPFDC